MGLITLLTDFGYRDSYVGILKGVIWGLAPGVQIADLTHEIEPQNIFQAALVLGESWPYFPAGTVHLAIVDPGVGTTRRPLAVRFGAQYFVGPDNGLAGLLIEASGQDWQAVNLDQPTYWLPLVSRTFHGRDIFAPVAAHLATGISMEALGSPISDPVRLAIPHPTRTSDGWLGQVIAVDVFGNLATNLRVDNIPGRVQVVVHVAGRRIIGLVQNFGSGKPGELVALIDSYGRLAVAVVNEDAANVLHVRTGSPVKVDFEPI